MRNGSKTKLGMQVILKPKKGNRMKRGKDADEELDSYADEELSCLREAMVAAAADDQSNKQKSYLLRQS